MGHAPVSCSLGGRMALAPWAPHRYLALLMCCTGQSVTPVRRAVLACAPQVAATGAPHSKLAAISSYHGGWMQGGAQTHD